MKKRTIYQNQSQELLSLFEQAGNHWRLMCVPMDFAKKDHVVMFCNGYGDILRKPFSVKNSPEGVKYLSEQVKRFCGHRGIKKEHVFFGGEDVNSYAENFVNTLRTKGWLFAGVNAHEAKKQRSNLQASTDCLDLMGIANLLLSRRANCFPAQSGIYRNLRTLVRHRRNLVVMSTEVRNQVHTVVDRLFPGFLDERKTGIIPFTKTCLYLMEDRFSPRQIRRRKRQKLVEVLHRFGTSNPELKAAKLQHYATQVLAPADVHISTLQFSLSQHVKHFQCLQEGIDQLEKEIAVNLAQTQGAFLSSIPGIGIVLAAGVSAEIGKPYNQKPLGNLVSYCGIIPRIKQTGGAEGSTYTGRVSKRCNRILKDYVVKSAVHIGLHGPQDLKADYRRRDAIGQHADFGMGRRFVRMAMCLMRTSQIYLPAQLRESGVKPHHRADYYLSIWPKLREKWRCMKANKLAFAKDQPLGQWRNVIQELYEIKLKF